MSVDNPVDDPSKFRFTQTEVDKSKEVRKKMFTLDRLLDLAAQDTPVAPFFKRAAIMLAGTNSEVQDRMEAEHGAGVDVLAIVKQKVEENGLETLREYSNPEELELSKLFVLAEKGRPSMVEQIGTNWTAQVEIFLSNPEAVIPHE